MQEKRGYSTSSSGGGELQREFTVNYLDYKKLLFLFNADPSEKCEL